jgi:hypothetical protein
VSGAGIKNLFLATCHPYAFLVSYRSRTNSGFCFQGECSYPVCGLQLIPDLIHLALARVHAEYFEYDNKHPGSLQRGLHLGQIRNYQLLKHDSVPLLSSVTSYIVTPFTQF